MSFFRSKTHHIVYVDTSQVAEHHAHFSPALVGTMSTVLQTDTFNENVRITLTLSFTGSLWRACRDISSMIQANGVLVRSHLTSCLLACGDGRLCREGVKRSKFCLKDVAGGTSTSSQIHNCHLLYP